MRDPEYPDHFWVNPLGMSFRHIAVSDLILVNHDGDVVVGDQAVNRAAFVLHAAIHQARPDVHAAAHAHSPYGKSFSSLGIPLDALTQDACVFYEDHTVIAEQGGEVVLRGRPPARSSPTHFPDRQGRHPPEPRPVHGGRDGRRGRLLVHQHGAVVPGPAPGHGRRRPRDRSATSTPGYTAEQTGNPFAGWFSFQPLWDEISRSEPDLFD